MIYITNMSTSGRTWRKQRMLEEQRVTEANGGLRVEKRMEILLRLAQERKVIKERVEVLCATLPPEIKILVLFALDRINEVSQLHRPRTQDAEFNRLFTASHTSILECTELIKILENLHTAEAPRNGIVNEE
jgi:GTPase Era involved in 16S rRNA processing